MAHTTFKLTATQTNAIANAAIASRTTRAANRPLANVWRAADGTTQESIRNSFLLVWIAADMQCDSDYAEIILSGGKGAKAVDVGAVNRCMAGFRFHIITNGVIEQEEVQAKPKASNHVATKKVTSQEAAMLAAFLAVCGSKARALELLNAK